MIRNTITSAGIDSVSLDSITAAIYIKPSPDNDIHLEHSTEHNFHVDHLVRNGILCLTAEREWPIINVSLGPVVRLYLPLKVIKRLDITGGASYVHLSGKEDMFESCLIDVAAAAVSLNNIYADTSVQTISGAIRLNNETVRSNIRLETMFGVIDLSLREIPDNVSVYSRCILPNLLGPRDRISHNEQYSVTADSRVGIVHLH